MPNRMAALSSALRLTLVGTLLLQGCCQHWSYGLNPGGKRDLGSLTDTLSYTPEGFSHVDHPCGVCADESPFPKLYRLKELVGSVTDRVNGQRIYNKRECEK